MTRDLHLVRHGEATKDETRLTAHGRRQSELLAERLRGTGFAAVHHGPLPRAAETASIIAEVLGVPCRAEAAADDFVPHFVPDHDEFFDRFPESERTRGPALAHEAETRFARPGDGPVLVVTHAFLISWLVRDALDAAPEQWLTLDNDNAALTVIRYTAGRSPRLVRFNDTGHLMRP
ncbi:histidine phosphatase family protein [Lentzea sp. NPDC042327]|uniref:histidine phosphatase family protein n=1 Tax=Lentzea sp. NPDC042327 TaxID=3154801 RepID=UPI00340E9A7C